VLEDAYFLRVEICPRKVDFEIVGLEEMCGVPIKKDPPRYIHIFNEEDLF
jgi:hypothetical protein